MASNKQPLGNFKKQTEKVATLIIFYFLRSYTIKNRITIFFVSQTFLLKVTSIRLPTTFKLVNKYFLKFVKKTQFTNDLR